MLFGLTQDDVTFLRRLRQREQGQPMAQGASLPGSLDPKRAPPIRIGFAYGEIPAAEFDANGTLTKPGKGEVKFHRLKADGTAVTDEDSLPTVAYNVASPSPIGDKTELICVRDQTIEGDPVYRAQPGFLVIPRTATPPPACFAFYDGYHSIGSDTVNWGKVPLSTGANYDTAVFEFDGAGDAIIFKKIGTYEVFYELYAMMPTSGGSNKEDIAQVEVQDRNGSQVAGTNTWLQSIGHSAGTSGDNVRRTGRLRITTVAVSQYVQLFAKAVQYYQGIQIEKVNLGAYYLGVLPEPSAT